MMYRLVHQSCSPFFSINADNAVIQHLIFGIFNYTSRLFILLKKCSVEIRTSVFKWKLCFSIVNNLADNFSEHFDVFKLKFKLVLFVLFNFVY